MIDPEFLARLGGGVRSGSASMRRLGEALAADGDVLAIAAPTDGDDALAEVARRALPPRYRLRFVQVAPHASRAPLAALLTPSRAFSRLLYRSTRS